MGSHLRGQVRRGALLYLDRVLLEVVEGDNLEIREIIHDVLGGVFLGWVTT